METIHSRIAAVIKKTGLTKTAFAKELNLSQPFVSNICSGASSPSDRTISDICKTFNVNETWIRTGQGEMTPRHSRDEEIAELVLQTLRSETDSFKKRFISVLCRLDESQWKLLENIIEELFKAKGFSPIVEQNSGQMGLDAIYNKLSPENQLHLQLEAELIADREEKEQRIEKTG